MLEHHHRIPLQVAHVNVASFDKHLRVFPHQEPAYVREEESSLRVVRVRVGLCELVMQAMVARPHENRVLHRDAVETHEHYPERQGGLVAAMRPQAMRSRRDPGKATHDKRHVH